MTTIKQIGESIVFTTEHSDSGARTLCGTIEGRDWCFERLVAYTVRTLPGKRCHVNADTLEGGHSF